MYSTPIAIADGQTKQNEHTALVTARAHAHTHTQTDRPVRRLRQVLLTPCSRVVEKLVKKFLAFYGTRRFIIVFTRHHHLSLH